ncbi:MAG: hypothetical protein CK425_10795 [Parachlamydia sp.]|nr:MAG: hypothetical protein CK425_10795 [Parachlamydia sp.]
MSNVSTSILNAQKALQDYQNLSEDARPKKAINSKYQVVAKHPTIADVFLKFISSVLPSNLHFAQTTPNAVLKQLTKLKAKPGITPEQKEQIHQIIEKFKKLIQPNSEEVKPNKDKTEVKSTKAKTDLSSLKMAFVESGEDLTVSLNYEGQLIGSARIFLKDGKVHIFTMQIIDKYQGKGFGKKAFHEIIDFLDNHPKYGQTAYYYLECALETPACHIYETAGFVAAPLGDPRCTLLPSLVDAGFQTMVRNPKDKECK